MATSLGDLVDLRRYPLGDATALASTVSEARAGLRRRGVAELRGFLHPAGVAALCAEAVELEGLGHHSDVVGTPYLGLPDESVEVDHPRRHLVRSALTAIAYDCFPLDSPMRRLYESDALVGLVADILQRGPLHRYADPLGALNVAVMGNGDELGWHFDMTDFVVSIALQSSEDGGDFEVACHLRSEADEAYGEVAAVLGGVTRPETLAMEPGTLLVFEGRRSLHRVTPVGGDTPRLVALLAYDTASDTDSSDLLKAVRYGRTTADPPAATRREHGG